MTKSRRTDTQQRLDNIAAIVHKPERHPITGRAIRPTKTLTRKQRRAIARQSGNAAKSTRRAELRRLDIETGLKPPPTTRNK